MLKTIKISVIMAILALVVFSQPCMARDFGEIFEECGIGAMIAPRSPGAAAVTNVTWDSGTTAISSNITCPDACAGGKEKVGAFIYKSYESLEKDLASGSGTYLDALTVLLGYDSQAKEALIEALRNDFAKVVADPTYANRSRFEKAEALYSLVYKNVERTS